MEIYCSYLNTAINFIFVPSCCFSKQDYATFSYLVLMVKASLSLDVSAQNIILKNAETEVNSSLLVLLMLGITQKPTMRRDGIYHIVILWYADHCFTVSLQHMLWPIILWHFKRCVLICVCPDESHCVPRENCGPLQWSPLVDYRCGCACRHFNAGSPGILAVEGKHL